MIEVTPKNYHKYLPMILMFYKKHSYKCYTFRRQVLFYIKDTNLRFGQCNVDLHYSFSFNFMMHHNIYCIPSLFFCDVDSEILIDMNSLRIMRECIKNVKHK